jgi:hypothetical protein
MLVPRRLVLSFVAPLLVVVSQASDARADAAIEAATAKELTKPAERRSGLVFGFGMGVGIAGASGYPNDSSKIGVPSYYDGSDPMGGGSGVLLAMYSLSDWLSFGAFYTRANFRSGQWYTYGGGGGIRVDLFPFYYLAPWARDLGVYGQFGIGTATLAPTTGSQEASNGTESLLGGGVFYEFFLGRAFHGHWAAGPTFEYDAEVTQSNQRYAGLIGGRVAFYTGK